MTLTCRNCRRYTASKILPSRIRGQILSLMADFPMMGADAAVLHAQEKGWQELAHGS